MNATNNLLLEDKVLSAKAWFFGAFGRTMAQRAALEKLLELRRQRFDADHVSFAAIYEDLAHNYVGYYAPDLHEADQLAKDAERILLLHSKNGKNTFRIGKLIHLRCQIQQRLNHQIAALELGEDALAIYNNTKLICAQRSALMHTLVYLHKQVGLEERADRLAIEVKSLDYVLSSRSARGRM
jgi:hypothetical protein